MKLAILISGRGSNMQKLIDACAAPDFPATVGLVISNRPGARGLRLAADAGVPTMVIDHTDFDSRAHFDAALGTALHTAGVELVCQAGFMRILTADFAAQWHGRIINIHPSLLPAFKGLHVHKQALEAGVRISGCTVHYVTADLDGGPIIAQAAVPVIAGDTVDTLAARILTAEHVLYPAAVRMIAEGHVALTEQGVMAAPGTLPDRTGDVAALFSPPFSSSPTEPGPPYD